MNYDYLNFSYLHYFPVYHSALIPKVRIIKKFKMKIFNKHDYDIPEKIQLDRHKVIPKLPMNP